MTKKSEMDKDKLRHDAERLLTAARLSPPHADAHALNQELEIHRIELELQNEELHNARVESEKNLERYTELYEFAPVGYITLSREGVILRANLTFAKLLDMERGKLVGLRLGILVKDTASFNTFLDTLFTGRGKASCEAVLAGADGTRHSVRIDATLAESGQVCRAILTDITEQKQVEEALRENEQRLAGLVNSAMDAIIAIDERQHIVLFNPAAEAMFGLDADKALGQPLDLLLPQAFRQIHAEHIRSFGRTGITSRSMRTLGTLSGVRANGEEFPIEASISQIEMQSGKLFTVILRDITERKRAEEALAKSKRQLRLFIEQAPISIAMLDCSLNYVATSRRWIAEYGRGYDDLTGLNHYEVHPDVSDEWRRVHRDALAGAIVENDDDLWIQADGSEHWLRWAVHPWTDESGKIGGIIISAEDITARKAAELALRQSGDDLNRAQAVGHIGSWRLDVQRNELKWSAENYRILGIAEGTPLCYETMLSSVHPDDRDYVDRMWDSALIGKPYDFEHRVVVDGKVKWVKVKAELEFDDKGDLVEAFGTTQDITERKQAELALHEVNQRKDEFLALLAHELRNPMAVTTTAVYLLQNKGQTDPETRRWATATISSQTEQLKRLVDDLLDVARIGRGTLALQKTQFDLVQLLAKVEQACRPLADKRQQHFILSLPSSPLWIEADSARLTQVVTNLLANAIKFTPTSGHIELSLRAEDGEAVICVRDTGRGIAAELLPGIFDIFTQGEVSLARDEGGLGLGLALVKKLVEYHGGSVTAASEGKGKGAEFTVRLPALPRPPKVSAHHTTQDPKACTRRILLAEDNAVAGEAMAQVLRHAGHSVRLAQDGIAALAAAKEELPEIAIFDIGLPAMDGFALARSMRSLANGQRLMLIALTGYGQTTDHDRSRSAGFDYHIVKPADIDQLLGLINAWERPGQA